MRMQPINASASPEVQSNENFETLEWAAIYGKRHPVTTGLTWGYYGGRWSGHEVEDGTLTLTDNADNYLAVLRDSGELTVSTSDTNWLATDTHARVYKITTLGGIVTAVEDHRSGEGGVHAGAEGGEGGGGGEGGTIGKHAIPITAAAMRPSATNGCAPLLVTEFSAESPNTAFLGFDPINLQSAQFVVPMPKSWNEGTVTFKPLWAFEGDPTINLGVVWGLQAVAFGDGDPFGAAFGTAQVSEDSAITAGGVCMQLGPESAPITIAGSPAAQDVVYFRIFRDVDHANDTMEYTAQLHGIMLYITTSAENDE